MNLTLKNWTLAMNVEGAPVLQYDNNTVVLRVTGDIPEGWTWELLLAHGEYLDVAHMDADDGGLTVILTAEQLAFDGYYTAQLRASKPGIIKHTTQVLFAVGDTLSGDEQWPEIPTAFTQALERAEAAIETAQEVESTVIEAAETAEAAATAATDSAGAAQEAKAAAETAQTAAESAQDATESARDDVAEMITQMGNVPVVKGNGFSATGTGVTQTLSKVNIKTGAETSETVPMPIANGESAGLMTPEQVEAIEALESRVGGLENQNVRLSYTDGSTPTAAEIRAFVLAAGYTDTDKWASIGVVVSATNHIWRYYSNTQEWTDIGIDTVQQASGSVKGIVQGSSTAGKVFVEADGTMSLNGYDALTSGISNLQSGKENVSNKTGTVSDDATKYPSSKAVWDYVACGNNGSSRTVTDMSANNILKTGFYYCAYCSDLPTRGGSNAWAHLLVIARNDNTVFQFCADEDIQFDGIYCRKVYQNAQWTAWTKLQSALTFDTAPTAGSTNPVTSGGIKSAIDNQATFAMQVHYTDGTTKTATIKGTVS